MWKCYWLDVDLIWRLCVLWDFSDFLESVVQFVCLLNTPTLYEIVIIFAKIYLSVSSCTYFLRAHDTFSYRRSI